MNPAYEGCDTNEQNCSGESEQPEILEEIEIEELAVDGICGVY
jgi:mycofactocin precursor